MNTAHRIVVLTGLSGAGKSVALRAFEDVGYYCVDNLPLQLIKNFLELTVQSQQAPLNRVAIVVDVRGRHFLEQADTVIHNLSQQGYAIDLVFLDADDATLLRRFNETRRPHPLAPASKIIDGITKERESVSILKKMAKTHLDTSAFTPHQLRYQILHSLVHPFEQKQLSVSLTSFSFRAGVPREADMVFDVRFLPNPFFIEAMRNKDGRDDNVRDFVLKQPEAQHFLKQCQVMIQDLLPLYEREGKSYLNIAIGCTGGQHRSVAMVGALAECLSDLDITLHSLHRELEA